MAAIDGKVEDPGKAVERKTSGVSFVKTRHSAKAIGSRSTLPRNDTSGIVMMQTIAIIPSYSNREFSSHEFLQRE